MARFQALLHDRPAVGCTLGFGATFSAQLIARTGYDWVLIDMEHNPLSAKEASTMTHAVIAASAGQCSPLIRVPSQSVEWIKWALDCGSHGIIVPMVQSQEEARAIVRYAAYPPGGQRSFGPAMAAFSDLDPSATPMKYLNETSKDIQIIPMIESLEGLNNAEAICSTDGVTSIFVGPVDLRLAMGLPVGHGDEAMYLEALQKIVKICKGLSKPVGIFAAGEEECRRRIEEGFDFLLCPGEAALLVKGARASLTECLRGVASSSKL